MWPTRLKTTPLPPKSIKNNTLRPDRGTGRPKYNTNTLIKERPDQLRHHAQIFRSWHFLCPFLSVNPPQKQTNGFIDARPAVVPSLYLSTNPQPTPQPPWPQNPTLNHPRTATVPINPYPLSVFHGKNPLPLKSPRSPSPPPPSSRMNSRCSPFTWWRNDSNDPLATNRNCTTLLLTKEETHGP